VGADRLRFATVDDVEDVDVVVPAADCEELVAFQGDD
jgi:hypothetical protein